MKHFNIIVFLFFCGLSTYGFSEDNQNKDSADKIEKKKEITIHQSTFNKDSLIEPIKTKFRENNACVEKVSQNPCLSQNSFLTDLIKNGLTIFLALIAGFIALYQMKSNIISSARIRWIEDLRETLSKLYPATLNIVNSYECHVISSKHGDKAQADNHYADYCKNMTTFNALSNKVRMQLNSAESEHKAIEAVLDVIDKKIHQSNIKKITGAEIESHLQEIVNHSKVIFKKEWDKSKKIFKI